MFPTMLLSFLLAAGVADGGGAAGVKPATLQKQWSERRFDSLERSLRDACASARRQPDGGTELSGLETALDSQFRQNGNWEAERLTLQQWKQQAPASAASVLVEAIYWRAHAAQVREAPTPAAPLAALAQYQDLLGRAAARLEQGPASAAECPLWHSLRINTMLDGGMSRKAVAHAYLEAVQRFPQDPQIHLAMARAYSPRLGGSAVQFEQFARRAVFFTREQDGGAMYARLYWREDGNGSEAIQFSEQRGLPEWSMMRSGFDDLLQRFPHDVRSLNKYASLACRANDRDTYGRLRQELGERIVPELWPDVADVESCDRKLGKGAAAVSATGARPRG